MYPKDPQTVGAPQGQPKAHYRLVKVSQKVCFIIELASVYNYVSAILMTGIDYIVYTLMDINNDYRGATTAGQIVEYPSGAPMT